MGRSATTSMTRTGAELSALAAGAAVDDSLELFDPPREAFPAIAAVVRPAVLAGDTDLVWGHRYRQLWAADPDRPLPVVDIGAATDVERLTVALSAENRAGAYRLSELDRILRFCERAAPEEWTRIAPLVAPDRDVRPQVERFRALPASVAAAVDDGTLDLRTGEAIPERLADATVSVLPLLTELSFSTRRQAVRMVVDLLRTGVDVRELERDLTSSDSAQLAAYLRRRRYPTLTSMEARLAAVQRRLTGTGVRLDGPGNFEGDRYTVTLTFGSRQELSRRLAAAARLEDDVDELLDLLF